MAKFVFKLEPVLRQRRMIEDQRQRELARLLREQMILQQQVRRLQNVIVEDKREMASSLVGKVDVERIRRHGVFSHRTAMHVQTVAIKLFELSGQIEIARAALLDSTRDRKAVERLREKQYQRWKKEQDRRETAQLDELAIQQYTRQGNGRWGVVA